MSDLIRIASYNIRAGLGTDLRRLPDRVLSVIAHLQADIVVLQEADFRRPPRRTALKPARIAELTGLTALDFDPDSPALGWHGNAILMRSDAVATATHRIDLPGLEPRGAVIADLAIGSRQMRVVGVHLGLLRYWRQKQLQALRAHLAELSPMPTVIAGDFNEWSAIKGVDLLEDEYQVLKPGHSYPSGRPFVALDRIALCGKWQVGDCDVVRTRIAARASDHLPIWADVSPA